MPRWLQVLAVTVALLVAIVLLFTVVFPWVEQRLEDPTIGAAPVPAHAAPLAADPARP